MDTGRLSGSTEWTTGTGSHPYVGSCVCLRGTPGSTPLHPLLPGVSWSRGLSLESLLSSTRRGRTLVLDLGRRPATGGSEHVRVRPGTSRQGPRVGVDVFLVQCPTNTSPLGPDVSGSLSSRKPTRLRVPAEDSDTIRPEDEEVFESRLVWSSFGSSTLSATDRCVSGVSGGPRVYSGVLES